MIFLDSGGISTDFSSKSIQKRGSPLIMPSSFGSNFASAVPVMPVLMLTVLSGSRLLISTPSSITEPGETLYSK